MAKKYVLIYKGFERFWHWMQALLIFFLAFTGFEIHGVYSFFGFEEAVEYHNIAAVLFLLLTVFAIFWHLTTEEWKHYIPTLKNIRAYLDFYLFGIFRNAPHPTRKTLLSKFNPLQRLTYFFLKILLIPTLIISGLLYMFYRYPTRYGIESINIKSLEVVALIHTAFAIAMVAFVIGHIYLTTTGTTLTSNIRAMLTGYEEIEDESGEESSPERGKEGKDE